MAKQDKTLDFGSNNYNQYDMIRETIVLEQFDLANDVVKKSENKGQLQ